MCVSIVMRLHTLEVFSGFEVDILTNVVRHYSTKIFAVYLCFLLFFIEHYHRKCAGRFPEGGLRKLNTPCIIFNLLKLGAQLIATTLYNNFWLYPTLSPIMYYLNQLTL